MELEKRWDEYSKAEQDEIFAHYFKWVRSKARSNIQANGNVALKFLDDFHMAGFELVNRAFKTYNPTQGTFKNYVWQNLHRRFAAVWEKISNRLEAENAVREGRNINREHAKPKEKENEEDIRPQIEISTQISFEDCTQESMEEKIDLEKNKVIVRWVNDVMAREGYRDWFVWMMHQNHDLSFQDIADILGVGKTTASNIFHKANEKAQDYFEQCLDGYAIVQRCAEKKGTDIKQHISQIVDSPGEVKIIFCRWYPKKRSIALLEFDTIKKITIGSIFHFGCKQINIIKFNLKENF